MCSSGHQVIYSFDTSKLMISSPTHLDRFMRMLEALKSFLASLPSFFCFSIAFSSQKMDSNRGIKRISSAKPGR